MEGISVQEPSFLNKGQEETDNDHFSDLLQLVFFFLHFLVVLINFNTPTSHRNIHCYFVWQRGIFLSLGFCF